MAHRVICCIDDSTDSLPVARVAYKLAARLEAGLVLTAVWGELLPPEVDWRSDPAVALVWLRLLESIPSELSAEPRLRVETGDPAERLVAVASSENAELIVVGSDGGGALEAAAFGALSPRLVGMAPCPVVVVPAAADDVCVDDGGVVCGIDGSPES